MAEPVENKIVPVDTFVYYMLKETKGLKYLPGQYLQCVIDEVVIKRNITFKQEERTQVIDRFREIFSTM